MQINVAPTPVELDEPTPGAVAVVIDVFRASTTIVTALAAGARLVLPTEDVEQAVRLAAPYRKGEALLGGERECQRIEGFHLGNSPREYTKEIVAGKVIIFTTTNGTRALLAAREYPTTYVGCFLNLSAIATAVAGSNVVSIVCAGNAGRQSLEDYICAGALVDRLTGPSVQLNDAALVAKAAWRNLRRTFRTVLQTSTHAQTLASLGYGPDMEIALKIDSIPIVPVISDGRITVAALA